jgi:hypothetical protein
MEGAHLKDRTPEHVEDYSCRARRKATEKQFLSGSIGKNNWSAVVVDSRQASPVRVGPGRYWSQGVQRAVQSKRTASAAAADNAEQVVKRRVTILFLQTVMGRPCSGGVSGHRSSGQQAQV